MAKKTRKRALKIPAVEDKKHEKHSRISNKTALEIEIVIVIAIAALIIYLLMASVFYPQKIQDLKTAIIEPAANKTPAVLAPNYENEYLQNSKVIGKQHNFGQFETTLIRIGFFKGQFRADVWVKNAGKETADFYVETAYLEKGGVKYAYAGGNFNGTQFAVNEERTGYILYKDVPKGIKGTATIVIGNSVGYSAIFSATTSSPHIYIIEI